MVKNIKGVSWLTKDRGSEDKLLRMVIHMKVFIKRINLMEKENIIGKMDLYTRDSFLKDKDMGLELLKLRIIAFIQANFNKIKQKDNAK